MLDFYNTRDTAPERALRLIVAQCRDDLLKYRAVVLKSSRSVGIHQTRVALRRMRAALGLFRSAPANEIARREIEALAGEAKWLAGECAPARDLHVFLTETAENVPAPVKRVANRLARLHLDRARARVHAEHLGAREHERARIGELGLDRAHERRRAHHPSGLHQQGRVRDHLRLERGHLARVEHRCGDAAIIGARGLTAAQVAYWEAVFARAVQSEAWKKAVEEEGWDSRFMGSREFARFLDAEYADYRALLSDHYIRLLFKSAPLHDIGKVGIPDHILLKPGKLTPQEFEVMKTHTTVGYEAIVRAEKSHGATLDFLQPAKEIALYHQEKWDGSGYPEGLAGEAIPLSARLMALADVYDALISKRVYKNAMSHDEALAIIRQGRGTHFDPDVYDAFCEVEADFRQIAAEFADP